MLQLYRSTPRVGGGRTHLMPVILTAAEVIAPDGHKHITEWIVPMVVQTARGGEPLSVWADESCAVYLESER